MVENKHKKINVVYSKNSKKNELSSGLKKTEGNRNSKYMANTIKTDKYSGIINTDNIRRRASKLLPLTSKLYNPKGYITEGGLIKDGFPYNYKEFMVPYMENTLWLHANCTYSNTVLTITTLSGNTLCWTSAGSAGFKKARRSSPFAALKATEKLGLQLKKLILSSSFDKSDKKRMKQFMDDQGNIVVNICFKGMGIKLRASVLKGLLSTGCKVGSCFEITRRPHNGCRPPKRRRL